MSQNKSVSLADVQQLLAVLDFLTPKQRVHFLKTVGARQMRVFEMACFNLATNCVGHLTEDEISILRKYKTQIELIANKTYTVPEKRKALQQKGGFLPAVLPILGTLLTSFLTS